MDDVNQMQENKAADSSMDLKQLMNVIGEWLRYLKSKFLIILVVALLGAAIGLVYSIMDKMRYTSVLTFTVEDEKSAGGGSGLASAMGIASSLGFDLGSGAGGAFTGANLTELMKSRRMVVQSLMQPITVGNKETSLADYYMDFTGFKKKLAKIPGYENISFKPGNDGLHFSRNEDSVLNELFKSIVGNDSKPVLAVSQKDKKVSIISIECTSNDEMFSKVFTESIAQEVSDFYIETKSKKARNNVGILQHQADSVRSQLDQAIGSVAAANDMTYNLNPALNIKRTPSARKQVDVQANTAILTQLVTNLELAKVALMKETPLIQVIDRPHLPLKREKVGKVKGVILGGVLGGFFIAAFLVVRRAFKMFV